MSIKHDFEDFDLMSVFTGIFWGAVVCALIMMCASCTTTEYVTVEKVRNDTTYITKHQRDSIYVDRHDSIVTYLKGDTVTVERWHYRDRWRDRVKTDTIYKSKTDTVYITKKNEKQETMTMWQYLWKHKGRLAIAFIILTIALWIWKTK